jgi:hypothetical protein
MILVFAAANRVPLVPPTRDLHPEVGMRNRLAVLSTVVGLALAPSAQAGHHLWDFTEIYSTSDGSVQFVELFTAENNEAGVGPFTVTASGHTFNFVTNLSTSLTANTYVLIATAGFGSLPGAVTPDYVLPMTSFFNTGGGTFNYAGGADIWNYGAVPTDGKLSLYRNGSTATNTPKNFLGQEGEVDIKPMPSAGSWGLVLLVGALLFAGSGLIRRRGASTA